MHRSVLSQYEELVSRGDLSADASQRALAAKLDALAAELAENGQQSKRSSLGWLFARGVRPAPPRGLYVWGAVGRGKTLLMDLFFKGAPSPAKRRVHFHAFMAEVHERIGEFRRRLKTGEVQGDDPIAPVAAGIAAETKLLCFDEFAVTDIADAMILGRLFERLFEAGLTVVATSNVSPDFLYEGGLNRALFLPFIEILKAHMAVFQLEAPRDYRLDHATADARYLTPLGSQADERLLAQFRCLTGADRGEPRRLMNKGHAIKVPEAVGGVARFSFADLCAQPLAGSDYLTIASTFHTLFVSDIPVLDVAERNEAKRFIILIDTIYDLRVRLVASAQAEPEALFAALDGQERIESARTASRLSEMHSQAYWDTAGPARPVESGAGQATAISLPR